jgi:hypothetical protein
MPASLIAGTVHGYAQDDTLSLDNGGDSGLDYLPAWAFGVRLPGPFTACAGIGLTPAPDSLDPALAATLPDLCL